MKKGVINKGFVCVWLSYVLWGFFPIYWKQLSQINSFYILASRLVWSMVLCAVIITVRKKWREVFSLFKDVRLIVKFLLAGIFITVNWGVYIYCVNSGHIIDSGLAYYLSPIISVLFGFLIFKEKMNKWQWIALVCAFFGVTFSAVAHAVFPYFALIMGGSFALYGAVKKKIKTDALVSVFMETLMMFPLTFTAMITMDLYGLGCAGNLNGWRLVLIPLSGVITTVPLLLYSFGVQKTSMAITGMLMYINPTIQLLIGVFLYNESFTYIEVVTFVLVWIAVIIFMVNSFVASKKQNKI